MRLPLLCALLVAGCTAHEAIDIYPDELDAKADGLPSRLKLVDDHRVDMDEPSDLAFHDGKLYAVSDRHSKIYLLDNDGDVRDVIDVEGVDLEAIAIDADGRMWIADEHDDKVRRVNGDGVRQESIEVDFDGNNDSGIEGLAFDDDDDLYVANEKNPTRIVKVDTKTGEEKNRASLAFADDLSALAFNPDDGHLYAMSDEEHKLWRLDSDFEKITSWKLPIDNPEGVAFDGNTVYVVSDAEERLYIFELD